MINRLKNLASSGHATSIQRALVAPVVMAIAMGLLPTYVLANQAMAQRYTCVACHQPSVKTVGPSWKDIAAMYAEGKGTAAQLAASIKAGSAGKWGGMPMPPQAQVPDAELQALAQWVLDGGK